jgi:hypothetical protein
MAGNLIEGLRLTPTRCSSLIASRTIGGDGNRYPSTAERMSLREGDSGGGFLIEQRALG